MIFDETTPASHDSGFLVSNPQNISALILLSVYTNAYSLYGQVCIECVYLNHRKHAQPGPHQAAKERGLVRGEPGREPQTIQASAEKGESDGAAPEPGHTDWHPQEY